MGVVSESRRGKSLGVLGPGGLGREEVRESPWVEVLEGDGEALVPGKEESCGTDLSTLKLGMFGCVIPGPGRRGGWVRGGVCTGRGGSNPWVLEEMRAGPHGFC